MLPAGTEVTCPSCDTEFKTEFTINEGEVIECDNCDMELKLVQGDLKVLDDDITLDEGEDEEDDTEESPVAPIAEDSEGEVKQ